MAFADFYRRLLEGVDDAIVAELERVSVSRSLEPHGYLFDQYSQARGVYVLERGVIMIERSSAAGRRQILGFPTRATSWGSPATARSSTRCAA